MQLVGHSENNWPTNFSVCGDPLWATKEKLHSTSQIPDIRVLFTSDIIGEIIRGTDTLNFNLLQKTKRNAAKFTWLYSIHLKNKVWTITLSHIIILCA